MGLLRIGEQEWDLVGSEGGETRLPSEAKAAVEFPTRWRVFGPSSAETTKIDWARKENYKWYKEAIPQVDAAVDELSGIPETLKVGDQTLKGQDVSIEGDTLDFSALFGGHAAGQQVYAMAEMEVRSETDVVFGAGCDWWMQWWVDGEAVFDTLSIGNSPGFPWSKKFHNTHIGSTDHCFRQRLAAGKHLIVVRTISGLTAWVLRAGIATPRDETLYALPRSNRWEFLPDLDEIRPPALDYWTHTMAIRPDLCFGDVTLECEFKQPLSSGNVGLIFGAQDSAHYYWAQIPHWGQLWQARALYAAISVAEGNGYFRNLKMELVPNVPFHGNVWRTLKVERRENCIRMWVAGVKGPCITDDTYGAGRVGIAGFSKYSIRNLKIDGKPVETGPWPEEDRRRKPWFEPVQDLNLGDYQTPGQLVRLSDGEVIMSVNIGRDALSANRLSMENYLAHCYRSLDAGRSWSQYAGPLRLDTVPPGRWFALEPGLLRSIIFEAKDKRFVLHDSTDRGLTLSEPRSGRLMGDWDGLMFREKMECDMLNCIRLNDGTFLAVMLRGFPHMNYPRVTDMIPDCGQGTWGTGLAQPYCTLSKDQGLTWSEPVPMDDATLRDGDLPDSPCGGCSETAVAQLPSGRIVAVSRPYRSPFMWQTHSDDGGQTWRVATYAPFSGAGGPTLVATRSGYLALIKRGPGLGLHVSVDGGTNWDEGTMIDFPHIFSGQAIEVEPDVVLVVYPRAQDEVRPALMRIQRISITPEGPVPLAPLEWRRRNPYREMKSSRRVLRFATDRDGRSCTAGGRMVRTGS